MLIVVDGNDGTGKTTLVEALAGMGFEVRDRGIPTKMTDDPSLRPDDGEVYLILDVPVDVSRERLRLAGKDLNERYHTVEDLAWYRQRFAQVAATLPRCRVIDTTGSREKVLTRALEALRELGICKPDA